MAAMPHQNHFDHYTTFSTELYHDFPTPAVVDGEVLAGGCAAAANSNGHHALMWSTSTELETYPFPFFDHHNNTTSYSDGALFDHRMGLPENDVLPQVPMMSSSLLSERQHNYVHGVMDMAVPVLPADYQFNMQQPGLCGGGIQSFGYQPATTGRSLCEFVDDCCGFGTDRFKSISPSSEDTWGNQCNQTLGNEESSIKVGRYSVEERKDRILRYLKKRNQRNFNKTIKYACRKTLADRRVRVRGRFARNNELSEEETMMKNNGMPDNIKESELFCSNEIQIKHDDEDWLQEAMASLLYFPYLSG